jgi:hypothetical protein
MDQPTYDDLSAGSTTGKHSQFPIANEQKRAYSSSDSLIDEDPLLIDHAVTTRHDI